MTQTNPDAPQATTVLGEKAAIVGGIVLTILAVSAVLSLFGLITDIVWQSITLIGLLYVAGLPMFYYLTSTAKDGVTRNELIQLVTYPVSLFRLSRVTPANVSAAFSGIAGLHIDQADDNSPQLLDEKQAKRLGYALALAGGICLAWAVLTGLVLGAKVLWLVALFWLIGCALAFWSSQRYKGGMTMSDIFAVMAWFIERVMMVVRRRRDVKKS